MKAFSPYNAACDDSTDDTSAIQKAINATGAGTTAIAFPAGAICKVASPPLNISAKDITFLGTSGFEFVTSDSGSSYIDCYATSVNCIDVQQQGFKMFGVSLKMTGTNVGQIASPGAPTLVGGTGGSLNNQTYYVEVSCTNSAVNGETLVSAEATLNPGAGGTIVVSEPTCTASGSSTTGTGWNARPLTQDTKPYKTVLHLH